MSSPLTALGFAALITVSLGSMAAKVAPTLSPLPIFALILVSKHVVALSVRVCIACVALIYLNSHNWFIQQNAYVLCTNYQQFWLCSVFPQSTKLDEKKNILLAQRTFRPDSGCSHNASNLMASFSGFSCHSFYYTFWSANRIEYWWLSGAICSDGKF